MRLAVRVLAVLAALLVGAAITYPRWQRHLGVFANPFAAQRFDRAKWLAAAPVAPGKNARGPMAEDLRRRYIRRGMTRTEVQHLLGPPNSLGCDEKAAGGDWYYLGPWGSMSIDGDYLGIHYGKDGRVESTEIYTH